jgi:hypothetical protein
MTVDRPIRRDASPAALQRVHRLLAEGEQVCGCSPRSPTMVADGVGVLRCATCHGIEAGQADRAGAA